MNNPFSNSTLPRILVLDDEDCICLIVSSWLKKRGCSVATASDGRQAIDLFQQALNAGVPFDLLLLDLTLPGGMGGQAVLNEVLAIDPDAKAIVSSGFIHEHVISSTAFKGFKGVLSKPYTEIQLLEVLEQVLT